MVEDEPFMREELREIFEKEGYPVVCIAEFGHVTDDILQAAPGLVLLDINLPGISGFEICRELKRKAMLPVLVLTSRDQMKDELHALNLGADEYLTKPCRKERLLARAANLLRRYEGRGHLRPGKDFLLDSQTYTLYIHDQSVVLPQNQGKLLAAFLAHPDELVTKETLCMALWGTTEYIDENALQVNLTRLKKTMKELEMVQQIETVRGLGYRLTAEEKIDDE
ncbi:response regulator transcription factor [Acidilutibacter cellobiosedens]|uniref:response regulator transcription factor n=1 Tax=Acidilutibacter cellobiosedens TaxID=2507161 RepID=UPI00210139FC|nr:response regulator transcription factor [Acidilutibacter cellobiosedens]